jgi:hypothetical protein
MGTRPNFHGAMIDSGKVRVAGESPDDTQADIDDMIDVRVTLAQGNRVASASVDTVTTPWEAMLDVTDPEGKGDDFHVGDAVAMGVEYRVTNNLTITWAQPVTIK